VSGRCWSSTWVKKEETQTKAEVTQTHRNGYEAAIGPRSQCQVHVATRQPGHGHWCCHVWMSSREDGEWIVSNIPEMVLVVFNKAHAAGHAQGAAASRAAPLSNKSCVPGGQLRVLLLLVLL
jgi:hypothetical protein